MQEIITTANTEILESQNLTMNMMQDFISFIDASPNTVETYTRGVKQLYRYLSLNGIDRPCREDIIAFRENLKEEHKATTVQN